MVYESLVPRGRSMSDCKFQARNSRQRAREACPPFRTIADRNFAKQRLRKTVQAVFEHLESLERCQWYQGHRAGSRSGSLQGRALCRIHRRCRTAPRPSSYLSTEHIRAGTATVAEPPGNRTLSVRSSLVQPDLGDSATRCPP